MAISVSCPTALPYYVDGHRKRTITDVTMDDSYPTGGGVVTPEQLRLSAVTHAEAQFTVPANATDSLGAVRANVTTSNGKQVVKIVAYDKDVPAEIDAADDLTGCVVRVTAIGY